MLLLFALARMSLETANIVINKKVNSEGQTYISVDWTSLTSSSIKTFRVFRSIDDREFASISTMDLEQSEPVKVLNIFPENRVSTTFLDINGNAVTDHSGKALTEKSAGLKVYMEGGYIGAKSQENYIKPYGMITQNGEGKQLVAVTSISFTDFHTNYKKIWDYDVVMFGSWDAFSLSATNTLNANEVTELHNYLDAGYGFLVGHDAINAGVGTDKGFGSFAKRMGIKLGSWGSVSRPNLKYDIPWHFEYYSVNVKVVKEGRLTQYPWSLGQVGNVMQIPYSHSASQWATEEVWFEFVDGNFTRSDDSIDLKKASSLGGNCVFYLTSKGNIAMIQTGHDKGQSSEHERMILANTLIYLKQRSGNKYVNDFDVYDTAPPEKPTSSVPVRVGNTLEITVSGKDRGSKFVYNIYGYSQSSTAEYESGNITEFAISGMKGFRYLVSESSSATVSDLILDATNIAPNSARNVAMRKNKAEAETNVIDGSSAALNAKIVVNYQQGKKLYLHVCAVDNKNIASEVAHFELDMSIDSTFASNNNPSNNNPSNGQTNAQTNGPTDLPNEGGAPGDNNQGSGNQNDNKKNNTGVIAGAVAGVVGALAAAAAAAAVYLTMCKPIAIVAGMGGEEEEEEEDELDIGNLFFADFQTNPEDDIMQDA